jgi:hypothetical protein
LADSGYIIKDEYDADRRQSGSTTGFFVNSNRPQRRQTVEGFSLPEAPDRYHTQYIGPNTYTKTYEERPIADNIGISYQEPAFRPVKKVAHTYIETEDPEVIEPSVCTGTAPDQVYDPRFTGYGTQDRAYIEPNIGQPRYMYKDVDAMRRGNFFIRSNIDHLPFAQTNGVISDNVYTDVRQMVDGAYLDQNSQFREALQQRLMSKRNGELAQLRRFPIRRDQAGRR